MGFFSKNPEPREAQVEKIVKALRAEDRAARGDVIHGDTSLERAGAVRAAAERNATPAEQYRAQQLYNAGHLRDE